MATAVAVGAIAIVNRSLLDKPEVQLPIVLIATVLAVLGGLSFLVIVFSDLGLATSDAPLGMPEGSVRAVIAISLLFLFMIVSIFLYANLAGSSDSAARNASPDVAKQLITVVASLAVSVAGFYFGTSSVAAAAKAVAQAAPGPSLRLVSPSSPQTLDKTEGKKLEGIRVESQPTGLAIDWHVEGDDGPLIQTAPNVFSYTRGKSPSDLVTLYFFLDTYPGVVTKLDVKAPIPPVGPAAPPVSPAAAAPPAPPAPPAAPGPEPPAPAAAASPPPAAPGR